MSSRRTFSLSSLLGCSRSYGEKLLEMDEDTIVVPNIGIGSWRLGLSLHQATTALQRKMRPTERVHICVVGNGLQVVLELPGVHNATLAFDGQTQLLERITICYPWPLNGVSLSMASSTLRLCGRGEKLLVEDIESYPLRKLASGDRDGELCYEGVKFTASGADNSSCTQISVVSTSPLSALCPPRGLVALRVSEVIEPGSSCMSGLQFDLEIGSPASAVDWTDEQKEEASKVAGCEHCHRDTRYVLFGQCQQEVQCALGEPDCIFRKEGPITADRIADFFFNYFALGVAIMFSGSTQCVAKFILYTNLPQSIHFGIYARCPFALRVGCCCSLSLREKHRPHGTGQHIKKDVFPHTPWREIARHSLCGCARERWVVQHDHVGEPANGVTELKTTVCTYDQFLFEVLSNGQIDKLTIVPEGKDKQCESRGRNPHRKAAENFDNTRQTPVSDQQRRSSQHHYKGKPSSNCILKLESPVLSSAKGNTAKQDGSARLHLASAATKHGVEAKPLLPAEHSRTRRAEKTIMSTEHIPKANIDKEHPEKQQQPSAEKPHAPEEIPRGKNSIAAQAKDTCEDSPSSKSSKQPQAQVRQTAASLARRERSVLVREKSTTPAKTDRALRRTTSDRGSSLLGGKRPVGKADSSSKTTRSALTTSMSKGAKDMLPAAESSPKGGVSEDCSSNSGLSWVSLDEAVDEPRTLHDYRHAFTARRKLMRTPPPSPRT